MLLQLAQLVVRGVKQAGQASVTLAVVYHRSHTRHRLVLVCIRIQLALKSLVSYTSRCLLTDVKESIDSFSYSVCRQLSNM